MTNILAGLYGFKPTDTFLGCEFTGDEQAGQLRMGHVRNALQTLQYVNKQDLQVYDHTVQFDDGTVVTAHRMFGQYSADVHVPHTGGLKPGQFYWIPGCVARYDCVKNGKNCIPNGVLKGEECAFGNAIHTASRVEVGLPSCGVAPDGSIIRDYKVLVLPGNTAEAITLDSGITFPDDHIPSSGSFSISCVVRLNEEIVMDYSFSEKTDELDCGYTIWNPVKPRVLTSTDGVSWLVTEPGSICPLIGLHIPSRFSNHYVTRTDPWPDCNKNFVTHAYPRIGYREMGTLSADEPLLTTDYSGDSPYWDKVVTGKLKTYEGEYTDFWEENKEIENSAPYYSFCKWRTPYKRDYPNNTRVVTTDEDNNNYYGDVYSFEFEKKEVTVDGKVTGSNATIGSNVTIQNISGTVEYVNYIYNHEDPPVVISTKIGLITFTVFTFKDYQYKKYIYKSNKKVTFGTQPFPVCHPGGYGIGINYCGLFFYNGNHILAGKINDFESEYGCDTIVSGELDIGELYHVCMTYEQTNSDGDNSGLTQLYIMKLGDDTVFLTAGKQSGAAFQNYDGWGTELPWKTGADGWYYAPGKDSPSTDWDCSWTYSANMDIVLPRFYHHALSKAEIQLLTKEVFGGVFVADDFEAKRLIAKGMTPVKV